MKGIKLITVSQKERKTAGEAMIKVKQWSLIKYRNKKQFYVQDLKTLKKMQLKSDLKLQDGRDHMNVIHSLFLSPTSSSFPTTNI